MPDRQPAVQLALDCDPDWTHNPRGLYPGTHTTEELDLHSQGLTWQEIKTMRNVDLKGEWL